MVLYGARAAVVLHWGEKNEKEKQQEKKPLKNQEIIQKAVSPASFIVVCLFL